MSAEIVVYTGDFTSYEPDTLEHFSRLASKFALGRRATFGVLGNHDYGPNWADSELAAGLAERAKAAGIRILRNEVAEHSGLHVVGLDDWWANHFKPELAFKQLSPGVAAVTLSHNPDTADLPGWGNYAGWILAGHTHGGQCKPPFLPPPLLPVRNRRYTAGEFVLTRERRMYINRGIGHLLPVRFNVRPEITHFRLVRA